MSTTRETSRFMTPSWSRLPLLGSLLHVPHVPGLLTNAAQWFIQRYGKLVIVVLLVAGLLSIFIYISKNCAMAHTEIWKASDWHSGQNNHHQQYDHSGQKFKQSCWTHWSRYMRFLVPSGWTLPRPLSSSCPLRLWGRERSFQPRRRLRHACHFSYSHPPSTLNNQF